MRKAGASTLGTLVAIAGVVAIAWLGLRSMTAKQRAAFAPDAAPHGSESDASPSGAGTTLVHPIPQAILDDAGKTPVARLDVVIRVDGLDLALDGAPACRDGHHRQVGRAPGGGPGSFDAPALSACVAALRAQKPGARMVAMVTRAGPAVPATHGEALIAALRAAGIADVVAAPGLGDVPG